MLRDDLIVEIDVILPQTSTLHFAHDVGETIQCVLERSVVAPSSICEKLIQLAVLMECCVHTYSSRIASVHENAADPHLSAATIPPPIRKLPFDSLYVP